MLKLALIAPCLMLYPDNMAIWKLGWNDEVFISLSSITEDLYVGGSGLFLSPASSFPGLGFWLPRLWYAPRLHLLVWYGIPATPWYVCNHWGITKPPGHTLQPQWRRVQMWAGASQRGWILALPWLPGQGRPSSQAAPNSQLKKRQPALLALNSLKKVSQQWWECKSGIENPDTCMLAYLWPCACFTGSMGALGQIRALPMQHASPCLYTLHKLPRAPLQINSTSSWQRKQTS